jgi:hypothetical protein
VNYVGFVLKGLNGVRVYGARAHKLNKGLRISVDLVLSVGLGLSTWYLGFRV